ncbi:MAG: HAMP domain-containing sensor histidine kinase [Cyanobacteria bacterium P01_A01_bin.135]
MNKPPKKISLTSRLFWSHIAVLVVGLTTLFVVGKVSSPRFFVLRLRQIEVAGFGSVRQVRTELVRGFEAAWSRGALWSLLVGAPLAGGVSYWLTRRIVRPLNQIEATTRRFAAGKFDSRVPPIPIPELHRLGQSFNRMADELEGVEQRRRDLVSDLTHELRTPLTVLEGYLEGLEDGTIEASGDLYHRLTRETRRMGRLVEDLQELSKLEAGYLPIAPQAFALYPLLAAIAQRFQNQRLEVAVILDAPADLPPVWADPSRTEQVLVNLVGNALRYTPAGQVKISAAAEPDDSLLWVAVTDTGIGITPEDLPLVFERFWRADRSRDRQTGGTGIGLAISRRLVELQGGKITVQSDPGVGSTFRFSLPLVR